MTAVSLATAPSSRSCARCRTELAPSLLSCPACHTLVHADALKELAANAERLTAEGKADEARAVWRQVIELLPPTSQQLPAIQARIAELTARLDAAGDSSSPPGTGAWWQRGVAALVAIVGLSLGKLKFLVLGLTKAKTFFSMFAFFGFYWTQFGWPLAAGLALSIYIHEMGHVHMLRRLGIDAGAPMFIPGIGAFVLLKQRVIDALTDAKIGLAGPLWGLGAGIAAYGAYRATGAPIWAAIAQLTGFLNLFNLIPVWQLDGSRGFHALPSAQRWAAVLAIAILFLLTGLKLLVIVGAVAAFRAFQKTSEAAYSGVLAAYVGLVAMHSLLAAIPVMP